MLKLQEPPLPWSETTVYRDISAGWPRPYVHSLHRRGVLNYLHDLSHLGIHTSMHLMADSHVWPSCSVTVAPGLLTEICTQCQRAKIPGTSFHHLEQSPSHCTASNTSTFTSLGLFYQPALIANASHQSIQAVRLELIDLLKVPRNFSVALFVAL